MKRAIFIPIIFFLTVVSGVLLLLPKIQTYQMLKGELAAEKANLVQTNNYIQELKSAAEKLADFEEPLLKIESALPATSSLPELLTYLQGASSQSGLTLENITTIGSFSAKKTESSLSFKEDEISLSLGGLYPKFKEFLKNVENSARMIDIQNINIESEEDGFLSISMLIKVYSY